MQEADTVNFYPANQIEQIVSYEKTMIEKVVQIIAMKHMPLLAILDFHSTCVMNIITPYHAYSFYPCLTLGDKQTLMCGPWESRTSEIFKKYEERGWEIVHGWENNQLQAAHCECKSECHQVGDSFCWVRCI
ncbi:hypothetical protein F5887DRAFT_888921 [Amanita rubescens]|nr:hypothetical protein F5887DRAFT_888921 [Amanita rubescens]